MKFVYKGLGLSAAASLALLGFGSAPAFATTSGDTVTIDIAAISDFHGHIENAARVKTYVDSVRAANTDSFFVANGDLVGGSAFVSAIDNDNPTMQILSAMGLQLSSTGNHEYDGGFNDLENRISKTVKFPYLVSNLSNPGSQAPYKILETSGVKVAFVGAVTADLPTLTSPSGLAGHQVSDPVAAVNAQAAALKDGNADNGEADVVVALIHETTAISKQVGDKVDAVVAGHTHHTVVDKTATGAAVVEPGQYGQHVGLVKVTYNKTTKKATSTAEFHKVGISSNKDDTTGLPAENPQVKAAFEAALAKAKQLGSATVGTIHGGADRATNDGAKRGSNRGSESTASNLIAEAFYQYSQGMARKADFGIMNPGGVRADLDANGDGQISAEESFTAQPFGNSYGILNLTGAQVYQLLEQQWADASTQTSRPMLALGLSRSIRYTYDPAAAFGSHIKQVYVAGNLVPRDNSRSYAVASNAFLLDGGDGFTVLSQGANFQDTGIIDNDVFNAYLQANPGLTVDYSQRSLAISGENALQAGAEATLNLASLAMTYAGKGQPLPTQVSVLLDGQQIGSAALDTSVVADLNETGQAQVKVMVPAAVQAGAHTLTVVAGPTSFDLMVQVKAAPAPQAKPAKVPGMAGSKSHLADTGAQADITGQLAVLTLLAATAAFLARRRVKG